MTKTSIAVIGINGSLGGPLIEVINSSIFADKISFPIKALTRSADKVSTERVQYVQADLTNTDAVVSQLKGIDVIIALHGARPDVFASVQKIAIAAKPKLYIPSQFGIDLRFVDYLPGFLTLKSSHSANVRASGVKVVDVSTGFFANAGTFAYTYAGVYGVDGASKTITQFGDANQQVSLSKFPDIAKTLLSLATSPEPAELPDSVRVYSDIVTNQQVWDTYERNHNVKLTIVKRLSAEEALAEAKSVWAQEGFKFERFPFYLEAIAAQGSQSSLFIENERELVNPNESLWKWEKF